MLLINTSAFVMKEENAMKRIIESYLERGFGSMNKNDFEVYIFSWLIQKHSDYKNASDNEISRKLKIPESKIKRLRYEAELRYGNNDTDVLWQKLRTYLSIVNYRKEEDNVLRFSIPDKQVRLFLKDQLQAGNRFCDSSFSENIVVISVDDLLYLLANGGIPKEDYSKVIQQVKSTCKEKDLPQSPTEIFKVCASDAVAKALSKVLRQKFTDKRVISAVCEPLLGV